jgi:hypothetical protein
MHYLIYNQHFRFLIINRGKVFLVYISIPTVCIMFKGIINMINIIGIFTWIHTPKSLLIWCIIFIFFLHIFIGV